MGIRPANSGDCTAISHLLDQLEYPDTASFLEEKIKKMTGHPDERLLVYEDGTEGRIIAFISLHFIPQLALRGDFARISYFAVEDTARSRGIGQEMEEYCTQLARERGCHLMEVHCHTRRTRAHDFYFRQGYTESPKYLIKKLK
ncbi:MAG: GNAT family N-acetyltransferase [Sphingobacteriales bacterium 50-39]|nr:GNAT family N-acetyltransferase [Sphingobacteriales bacterium]OJW59688.1 MAG: GNAT family N-acetyltransferase [Sphingobacteriales bacterium 50-39]